MPVVTRWDYLVVSASNAQQSAAIERRLAVRDQLGRLDRVRNIVVVADPEGQRIGSGSSTVRCLTCIIERELSGKPPRDLCDSRRWTDVLSRLRILIVHAGGDSRRLPAYSVASKLLVPVPDTFESVVPTTLFDLQWSVFSTIPDTLEEGRIVVASGDVFVSFEAADFQARSGITGIGCRVPPPLATQHGVYIASDPETVERFLQKPSLDTQHAAGAISSAGTAILDTGLLCFDADSATQLLAACGTKVDQHGWRAWSGTIGNAINAHGFDLYREMCCALGSKTGLNDFCSAAKSAGSRWSPPQLKQFFDSFSETKFSVNVPKSMVFRHVGTNRRLLEEAPTLSADVPRTRTGGKTRNQHFGANNRISDAALLTGENCWVEGCRIQSDVHLGGDNMLVGVDVESPIALPFSACVDVVPGVSRSSQRINFVRCYFVDDPSSATQVNNSLLQPAATFCGRSLDDWLQAVGAGPETIWPDELAEDHWVLWKARLFPAELNASDFGKWLWMLAPDRSTEEQRLQWIDADRYSFAEMADLADNQEFFRRRSAIRAEQLLTRLHKLTRPNGSLSAVEIAELLRNHDRTGDAIEQLMSLVNIEQLNQRNVLPVPQSISIETAFRTARVLHSIATALRTIESEPATDRVDAPSIRNEIARCFIDQKLVQTELDTDAQVGQQSNVPTADDLKQLAFDSIRKVINSSNMGEKTADATEVGQGRIITGQAPVRIDLGGGWTDTPPYSLEFGGRVVNAAVKLMSRLSVQVSAWRILPPYIRINSVDQLDHVIVEEMTELLDCGNPGSPFSLAKAAILQVAQQRITTDALSSITFQQLLEIFGGGFELRVDSGVPKGSGLGTSSIIGSVCLAVISSLAGIPFPQRELFHATLKLEQSLTTGGGWQDQIGGVIGGAKLISTEPGLIPNPRVEELPAVMIDPRHNNGQTLLYYTGVSRLAKNILSEVVGRFLDRDPTTMRTLDQLREIPDQLALALRQGDMERLGRLVGQSWSLNKTLVPTASNASIDSLMNRIAPYVWGAKLLGAGGGGFLLMVCKSPSDAQNVCDAISLNPPSKEGRFYDFEVSDEGLSVEML